ncbi:hypothetical protein [Bacteroides acidifaciens]|uniref:hypothetical protein n=2 Tax=Bacteroides acidifaciens TaxID=85831 RepID=UPI00242BE82E|nr:hypothetical protein [Bacteroides acidifaciens]
MYRKMLILLLGSLVVLEIAAQELAKKKFTDYADRNVEHMGILCKKLKGFKFEVPQLPFLQLFWTQGRNYIGSVYEATALSKDGNCLILYPNMNLMEIETMSNQVFRRFPWSERPTLAREQVTRELQDALRLQSLSDSIFSSHVVTMSGGDVVPFNADTVFVAQLSLHKPYRDKYEYATGIYVWKEARRSMVFHLFFTEEGKRHEENILSKLYKSVTYLEGDEWNYDEQKVRNRFLTGNVLKVINLKPMQVDDDKANNRRRTDDEVISRFFRMKMEDSISFK